MRIGVIAPQSVSMVRGGPEVQVRNTMNELAGLGVEAEYCTPWTDLRTQRLDLVHVFGANFSNYDMAVRLSEYGIPFVVSTIFFTLRSAAAIRTALQFEQFAGRFFKGIWTDYGFAARLCRLAGRLLPNTEHEAEKVTDGFGITRGRVTVVPNGVDERFSKADPTLFEEKYGIHDFVLNVGHIGSRRKNVLNLIRAVKHIDCPLVIVGQVQRNEYGIQCLEEASENKKIMIIEGLSNDDPLLASAYAAARVFALPSHFETPGIAALEAGLAGARVVITPHGGTKEYFSEHADYADPFSVSDIATKIKRALERPTDTALREKILREYLWQHVARRTLDAYRVVLEDTR